MNMYLNDDNSNEHQLQLSILQWLSKVLVLEDPIGFLTKFQESIYLQIQKEKAEAEAKACNRLIAIIIEYAKSQRINSSNLPYLKRKSYDELCAYIKEFWPMLIPQI